MLYLSYPSIPLEFALTYVTLVDLAGLKELLKLLLRKYHTVGG
jgi:hypothetical protein